MKPRSKMYKFLKHELEQLGHWKLLGRGDPVKANSMIGKNALVD